LPEKCLDSEQKSQCLSANGEQKRNHLCSVCLKCFSSPSKLRRHYLIHTDLRPFDCWECGKTFRQLAHLKVHQETHRNGLRPFKCPICGVTFRQAAHLKKHQAKHRKPCEENALQQAKQLQLNIVVKPEEPYEHWHDNKDEEAADTVAPEETISKSLPEEHTLGSDKIKNHRTHPCLMCLKCFDCPSKLQRHYLTHTGQKPFRCFACGKEFRQAIHLKVHQRTHNKWRAFKCCLCHKSFDCPSKLQRHYLSHTGQKPFECYVCESILSHASVSQDKKQKQHTDTLRSDVLKQNHEAENGESVHDSKRIYQCTRCLKCFEAPSQQDRHHCSVCPKSFNSPSKLKRHFLIHTGLKPFKCYMCEKSFRQLCHLQNHQHTHSEWKFCDKTQSDFEKEHPCSLQNQSENHPPSEKLTYEIPWCASGAIQENIKGLEEQADCVSEPHGQNTNQCLTVNGSLDPAQEANDTVSDEILEECATDSSAKVEDGLKQKEKKHKCSECLKCFSSPSKLERHYLIHAGEKPFECSVCNKSFRQAAHLKVHQRIHAKQFGGSDSLQQEVTNNDFSEDHQGQNMHQSWQLEADSKTCPQYNTNQVAVERSGDDLPELDTASESDYTNGYWSSSSPSGLFKTERKLQVHKCTFKNQTQAKSTSRSLYQCAICFKSFDSPSKLKRHYVIHTGQRPFECSVCRKTFTQSCHLKTHQLTHFK
uniref:C2H2-type domain-containing protein n=1 Tax=Lepisosteus oculatus TaxID=7918 RepID=W5N302_LEPOC